jgi:uncharacterized membrane protein
MRFPFSAVLAVCALTACGPGLNDPQAALQPVEKPPAVLAAVEPVTAHGVDGDWSVNLNGSLLSVTRPSNATLQITVERDPDAGPLAWVGEGDTFVLTTANCLDGKSATVYPMTAALTLGGATMKGCANFTGADLSKPSA